MTYFKSIKSLEDLKSQYKALIKANHPDNGGDLEAMKEINVQFDALFAVWKNRKQETTGDTVAETAESVRREFYTANGWKGSRYDYHLSLKEIAKIVRAYVKAKYPTCKFSVRTEYASMCQELHVEIKEFPAQMFKTGDDLRNEGITEHVSTTSYAGEPIEYDKYTEEVSDMITILNRNNMFNASSWTDEELLQAYDKALAINRFYGIKTEYFKAVLDDVNSFVQSYNYDDSDGMIDYFDNNFYYFNCKYDSCKQVEKTARIKNKSTKPRTTTKETAKQEQEPQPETIEQKSGYTYEIKKGEDTRDGSELWIVRIKETLDRAAYIAENKAMRERGGYYSKFKHGFIFRFDPAEVLTA